MEYIAERITIDGNICNDRPTIRGTRITVQTILEFLSVVWAQAENEMRKRIIIDNKMYIAPAVLK